MKVTAQLEALEEVAKALGVQVSFDTMAGLVSGSGGLCRVRGAYRVIIDRRLRPAERVNLLADALSRFDASAIEMPDEIRTLLAAGHSDADARQSA